MTEDIFMIDVDENNLNQWGKFKKRPAFPARM
jgi:hypothetical protein